MESSNGSFLESLARAQPNPGGGAAAAYGASLALALLEKIVRLELNRCKGTKSEKIWGLLLGSLYRLASELSALREEDGRAYLALADARASGVRGSELTAAFRRAVLCPAGIMKRVHEALAMVSESGKGCKKHLVSDLQVACEFLGASFEGAFHIAHANIVFAGGMGEMEELRTEILHIRERTRDEFLRVREELASR